MTSSNVDIEINMEGLDELREKLSSDLVAKIGIFGGGGSRDPENGKPGKTNAEIGLTHEFGSVSENIPPRSFLRMPLEFKGKEIAKTAAGDRVANFIMEGDLEGAMELLGVKAEEIIGRAFSTGGFGKWVQNAPMTVRLKNGSSPLIHTRQLQRSVTSKVEKDG